MYRSLKPQKEMLAFPAVYKVGNVEPSVCPHFYRTCNVAEALAAGRVGGGGDPQQWLQKEPDLRLFIWLYSQDWSFIGFKKLYTHPEHAFKKICPE